MNLDRVSAAYGRTQALKDVSLEFDVGVCALLGPNGAGKTTLLSVLMGLKSFTGQVAIGGRQVSSGKSSGHVGYLPQQFSLAPRFTVTETVAYAAWCSGAPRRECASLATAALAQVDLADKHNHRVLTLSGGERQRLGVACAISRGPSVLLMDEPTVGLDPSQRSRFRQYLDRISETTAVMMATHLLEDVQIVAQQVVVLYQGGVRFDGTKAEMAGLAGTDSSQYESALERAYRHLTDVPG